MRKKKALQPVEHDPGAGHPPVADPTRISRADVLAWAKRLKREAEHYAESPLPASQLLTLELSARLLLNDRFRDAFCDAIRLNPGIVRGFTRSDPARGGALFRTWGVVEIIPPSWDSDRKRFHLLAPFPIPVVFWGDDLSDRDGTSASLNTRLLIDHRAETSSHPVYQLVCRTCGWFQGPLGSTETFHSKVPDPQTQVEFLAWSRRDPSFVWGDPSSGKAFMAVRRGKRNPHLKALAEQFSEEVWGYEVGLWRPPPSKRASLPPPSGELGDLLDYAMGFRFFPESMRGRERGIRKQRRRLRVLAWAIGQIECQLCRKTGGVRFLARFLMYVDADPSGRATSRLASTLSETLKTSRKRVSNDPLLDAILWLPPNVPDHLPQHIAGRIARAIDEARGGRLGPQAPGRRIALWVIEGARGDEQRWAQRIEDTLEIQDEETQRQSAQLRLEIRRMVKGQKAGQIAGTVSRMLEGARFGKIGGLIIEHYNSIVWPRVPGRRAAKPRRRK